MPIFEHEKKQRRSALMVDEEPASRARKVASPKSARDDAAKAWATAVAHYADTGRSLSRNRKAAISKYCIAFLGMPILPHAIE